MYNNLKEQIENLILPFVEKPERYIGGEGNLSIRSPEGKTRIVLAFPDVYEVGFSNTGLKILYHLINRESSYVAERAYAPWVDFEALIRKEKVPLTSVESFTPVKEFDIIGFSLQHELCYTNILNMLDLSGIPFLSSERKDFPLIIAGGPGSFNPEPLSDFIDLFVTGDGEEIILDILHKVHSWKENKKKNKEELLESLADLQGVYIPSFYDIKYYPLGEIMEIKPDRAGVAKKIRKNVVKDLDKAFYPEKILLPLMEVIHDRAVIELFRGCTQGCRFCQAGYIYRPVRERNLNTCLEQAKNLLMNTGYPDLSLSSLSSSDYSNIKELIKILMKSAEDKKVSISLPSMRIDTFSCELAEEVQKVRKTGFTFAPEAGSERLRKVINKKVTEEDLINSVETALSHGWKKIKLYFMIGLPSETEEDLQEMADLIKKVMATGNKHRFSRLSVSFSTFVPKPHTPFQWEKQDSIEKINEKQKWLIKQLKGKKKNSKLFISFHEGEKSFLEGVFARGDRKLGKVLLKARDRGARFDNWTEQFDFSIWQKAFEDAGVSPEFYTDRERREEEILPWDHISPGIDKIFLREERRKAFNGEITTDCRSGLCFQCGVCGELNVKPLIYPHGMEEIPPGTEKGTSEEEKTKIRIKYTRTGNAKFISHLGLTRIIERAIRRGGFPVAFSEGFSPKPKISPGPPLSSGIESICEVIDIIMTEKISMASFIKLMNNYLPAGIKILTAKEIPLKSEALNSIIKVAVYKIDLELKEKKMEKDEIIEKIYRFIGQEKILFEKVRKKSRRIIDIRPLIIKLKVLSSKKEFLSFELWLNFHEKGTIKPKELMDLIHEKVTPLSVITITRTGLLTENFSETV